MWQQPDSRVYFCPIQSAPAADSGFESESSVSPITYDDVIAAISPTPSSVKTMSSAETLQQERRHRQHQSQSQCVSHSVMTSSAGTHHEERRHRQHQSQSQCLSHNTLSLGTADNGGRDHSPSGVMTSLSYCTRRIKQEDDTSSADERRELPNALDFFRCLYSHGR